NCRVDTPEMATPHKREHKRPFAFTDQVATKLDLRAPRFPEGTPSPVVIRRDGTMLGIVPRTAVMQAVARIEAQRTEGHSHHSLAVRSASVLTPARREPWSEYRELGLAPVPSKTATK